MICSVCFSCCLLRDYLLFPGAVWQPGWDWGRAARNRGGTATKWRTLGHGPPPVEGVEVPGSSPYTGVALLFPQSQVLGFGAFPKKYSCYLLKQILSPPHLIIQWWTLELSTGWKITRFSKYKIPLSAAFASPSFSLPWPRQPPAIQMLTVSAPWREKERRTGGEIHFLSVGCLLFFLLSVVQGLCRFTWYFVRGTVLVGTNEFICRDARSLEI